MVRRGSTVESGRGLAQKPCKSACSVACDGEIWISRGYETGTFWDWRPLAGTRDVSRHGRGRARDARSRPLTRRVPVNRPSALPALGATLTLLRLVRGSLGSLAHPCGTMAL